MTSSRPLQKLKPIAQYCLMVSLVSLVSLNTSSAAMTAELHQSAAKPAAVFPSADVQNKTLNDSGMDQSVLPGEDFNRFANGGWEKTVTIPDHKVRVGGYSDLIDESDVKVANIIEATRLAKPGSAERKIADYYQAFLNIDRINQRGLEPLQAYFDKISGIRNKTDLAQYLGASLRADVDPLNNTQLHTENLFGLWVAQAFHDHTTYAPYLLQGGLGMPDREYYLSKNPKMLELRGHYLQHISALLKLAGIPDAEQAAQRILNLEIKIAQGHATVETTSDILKADNSWKTAEFSRRAPGLDWNSFFEAAQLSSQKSFIVWHPGALKASAALIASTPLQTWQDYLRFHAINQRTSVLPQVFFDQKFSFTSKMSGAKAPLARSKYAIDAVNFALGEEVGKLYSAENFSAEAKQYIGGMVQNILSAFSNRVARLNWMSAATKAEALNKIKATYVGVGYPDQWKDYTALRVDPEDAFGNRERANEFIYQQALAKFSKPVDVTEWCMNPQLVNAVNMPLQNAIHFPAAYLQKPNFDMHASIAANYGALGATIGHEISHSFDNSGAMIDSKGHLRNWWSKADLKHFQDSSKALVAQFNAYRPFPDLSLNGQLTLGENIADLAGLTAAFDAYRTALKQKGMAVTEQSDREFFIAYAQSWRSKMRDETLRTIIVTNGHAPDQYRVLSVRNLEAWYQAFDIKPNQSQYLAPKDRVKIW